MKKKLIVAAISSALVAPSAFAAQDDLGMNYTSAAEGFYGSIRALYRSGTGDEDSGSNLTSGSSSRLGVQGTNDLGGGMEGYYRVEFNVGDNDGDAVKNRLRLVGLRGGFGELEIGSLWDDQYNFVTSMTDMSPTNSGNFAPYFRIGDSLQYRTPDLNGFQGSIRVTMKDGPNDADTTVENQDEDKATFQTDDEGMLTHLRYNHKTADFDDVDAVFDANDVLSNPGIVIISGGGGDGKSSVLHRDDNDVFSLGADGEDENDLDAWSLSAKYSFQGFTVAANYENKVDELPSVVATAGSVGTDGNTDNSIQPGAGGKGARKDVDDAVFWAVGLSYGQDNWYVGGWYGENDVRTWTAAENGDSVTSSSTESGANGADAKISDEVEEIVSIGASVDVDKVTVYGVYEVKDNVEGVNGAEDAHANVGVLYRLGSNTNAWIEYYSRDLDSQPNEDESRDEDDIVIIGLRHNF